MRRRLFWSIYATYLVVGLLCTLAVGVFAVTSARGFYRDQTESELQARAALVREQLAPLIGAASPAELQALARRLGEASGTRLTVIAGESSDRPLGTVLADSEHEPTTMENHSDRPEVLAALAGRAGRAGRSIRFSTTLGLDEMYVAVPLRGSGGVDAVVRAAMPLTTVNDALGGLYWRIALGAVIVALLAAVIGLFVTRRISRQMVDVRDGAERFAAGDFSHKLSVPRTEEFAAVAESLNGMAERLDEKIRTLTRERNEREAVLASMVEAVIAVDSLERVITVNDAAARLLAIESAAATGRSIQEVVRNPELQRLVAETLAGHGPLESELTLRVGAEDRTLQANATLLQGDEAPVGGVVVLNDVTRLKRLEAVRRDFVANVSHELKTPVTSIKGFAETLVDGAMDDHDTALRFLRIISGQADRLNSIIEDLLALSTLEASRQGGAPLSEGDLCDVAHVAVEVCEPKAQARDIFIAVSCSGAVFAPINPPLLEQAVVNLVDNAVKYSPEGSSVQVSLESRDGEVVVAVRDHGPGIAREHLPRLFERFYRVDKARSRDLGGTGLGLSIVKHIAQVHGGRVAVESKVGQGSTFRLFLPRG